MGYFTGDVPSESGFVAHPDGYFGQFFVPGAYPCSNPYGTITSFDPPEGKQTTATCINDGGAIGGYYFYDRGSGPAVGFIRVPQ